MRSATVSASRMVSPGSRQQNSSPPMRNRISSRRRQLAQYRSELHQHPVAGIMAPAVIDRFEMIEVEDQQRRRRMRLLLPPQQPVGIGRESPPVRQPGQRIRLRQRPLLASRRSLVRLIISTVMNSTCMTMMKLNAAVASGWIYCPPSGNGSHPTAATRNAKNTPPER